jgi:rubrerythrin
MVELKEFYNDGFGWICRRCEAEFGAADADGPVRSRLMREGEDESKQPVLSTRALAQWSDETRAALTCPRCGVTEKVNSP